jgi:hypothetical protein
MKLNIIYKFQVIGQLSTAPGLALDFEAKSSWYSIEVADMQRSCRWISFYYYVDDLNEAPYFSEDFRQLQYESSAVGSLCM